jgi:hypothetical protein
MYTQFWPTLNVLLSAHEPFVPVYTYARTLIHAHKQTTLLEYKHTDKTSHIDQPHFPTYANTPATIKKGLHLLTDALCKRSDAHTGAHTHTDTHHTHIHNTCTKEQA